jgi:hypothetical protein
MRSAMLVVLLGTFGWGQSMVETAAAAAGGSVGGVAGKKVSDGLTKIFEKIDKQTGKAAKQGSPTKAKPADSDEAPLFEVGPGVPKGDTFVPPPPPPANRHVAVRKPPPAPAPPPPPVAAPVLPPPPPPEVTARDLSHFAAGMNREDILKVGAPAARITMFDDGHLVEIYRYMAKDNTIGVVRLSDGRVSTVQMP